MAYIACNNPKSLSPSSWSVNSTNRVFSLTWPACMQIYWDKGKSLHKKRVQLPEDWFGTPTWPPFHCFWTPIWPPWRHVKTLYSGFGSPTLFLLERLCPAPSQTRSQAPEYAKWPKMAYYARSGKTILYELAPRVSKILFLPRENKIHIFKPPCDVLFII